MTGNAFSSRNLSWMVAGNVSFALTLWLVLAVLARGGGAENVGEFVLALAITTPIMMLAQLRLRDVVATDAGRERPFSSYLTLTAITAALGIVISVGLALLLEGPGPLIWIVLAWAIARGIESLSLILYGLEQQQDEMSRVGRSLIARGVLAVVLFAIVFRATQEVAWAAAAIAVAYAIVLVGYDLRGAFRSTVVRDHHAQNSTSRLKAHRLRALVLVGLPLGFVALLTSLNDSIPRLLLNESHSKAALGVFGAFGFIVVGGSMFTRSLGHASGPRLGAAVADGDGTRFRTQLLGLTRVALLWGVLAIVGAAVLGRFFLAIVFGEEFAEHHGEFVLIMIYAALLFLAAPFTVALIAARRYRSLLAIQAVAVAAVFITGMVAIPPLGVLGAVFALIAGGTVRVLAMAALLAVVARSLEGGRERSPAAIGEQ